MDRIENAFSFSVLEGDYYNSNFSYFIDIIDMDSSFPGKEFSLCHKLEFTNPYVCNI